MGRLSASERREAILQAAMPLFADRGFEAVKTRAVADAAGISEALLYRHFPSKAALYEAVLAACTDRIEDNMKRIEDLPVHTGTLVLGVYLMMRSIQVTPLQSGDQAIPRLMLRSLLGDGVFAREFVAYARSGWLKLIEECILAGIEAGEINNTVEGAITAFWLCNHVSVGVIAFELPADEVIDYPVGIPEELFLQSVSFALRGLGLTDEAMERHFQPAMFELLIGQAPS